VDGGSLFGSETPSRVSGRQSRTRFSVQLHTNNEYPAVMFPRIARVASGGVFAQSSLPINPDFYTFEAGRRTFASSASRLGYEDTISNLRIHKDTKVLCQGFTGKTVNIELQIRSNSLP
jgi:hypothetical protein